ncbi:MAG TPA: hypothetical protein VGJ60_25735, partial [Chloroflexota bacterium]
MLVNEFQNRTSRRTFLLRVGGTALGAATLLAACGPSATPAANTPAPAAPAPTAAPTAAPKPAATTAPAAAAPTTAPAPAAAAPTTAPAAAPAGGAATGTLKVANADFGNESMDPINIESLWGWAMYDSLLTFDPQGNVVGNVAESYDLSPDG